MEDLDWPSSCGLVYGRFLDSAYMVVREDIATHSTGDFDVSRTSYHSDDIWINRCSSSPGIKPEDRGGAYDPAYLRRAGFSEMTRSTQSCSVKEMRLKNGERIKVAQEEHENHPQI